MPSDILTANLVKIVGSLSDHETICSLLEQERVISRDNSERILSKVTSAGKTRELLDIIGSRFRRGFPLLCYGLAHTHQDYLLRLLDPTGLVLKSVRGLPKLAQLETTFGDVLDCLNNEEHHSDGCAICFDAPATVVFLPCRHLVTCRSCAEQLTICSHCRGTIESKLDVFIA